MANGGLFHAHVKVNLAVNYGNPQSKLGACFSTTLLIG